MILGPFGLFPVFGLLFFSCFSLLQSEVLSVNASSHCADPGWASFNGSCFRIIRPGEVAGQQFQSSDAPPIFMALARPICLSMGAELASIHSSKEDAFVRDLIIASGIRGFYLIGMLLDRVYEPADVFWTDGSPVDFGNPMDPNAQGAAPWKRTGAGSAGGEPPVSLLYDAETVKRRNAEPEANNAAGLENSVVIDMSANGYGSDGWADIAGPDQSLIVGALCRKDIVPKPKQLLATHSSVSPHYPLIAILALITQFYVLWLIIVKSPGAMKNYRIYLCANVISDMLAVFVIGVLINPDNWLPHVVGATVNGLAQYAGIYGGYYSFFLAVFAFVCQAASQIFSLFHRYCAIMEVEKPKLGEFINGGKPIVKWVQLIFTLLIASAASYGMCNSLYDSKELPELIFYVDGSTILFGTDAIYKNIPMIAFDVRIFFLSAILAVSLFTLFLVISLYFTQKMIRYLKERQQKFSKKVYKMHIQLVVSLKMQLLLPCVLVGVPLLACLVLALVGLLVRNPSVFPGQGACLAGILLFELFAPANTLVLLLSISPFRKHLTRLIRADAFRKWIRRVAAGYDGSRVWSADDAVAGNKLGQKTPPQMEASTVVPSAVLRRFVEKAKRQARAE